MRKVRSLTHTHTHTLYSRHAFRPRLRPSVSAHHPSNTTQISCNPFPSSAGLYSIRRSLPWGLHHFITPRLMRRDLTSQPPTLDNTRTCQLLTQPWKVPAACGWITRKWAKERGFWAESDQKTSKDPLQTPSVWDHGGGGHVYMSGLHVIAVRFTVLVQLWVDTWWLHRKVRGRRGRLIRGATP